MEDLLLHKYGPPDTLGWGPRLRRGFGYYTPDDIYEAYVASLVRTDTVWLEVGCGRDLFPSNGYLARQLSHRCSLLVGVDPSNNIDDNEFVHQRVKAVFEDFRSETPFDLVTMRMVAEHVPDPAAVAAVLARCVKAGGQVVVYTVNKWSLITVASSAVPFRFHHPIKRALWGTDEQDTFPVFYRMNTRQSLRELMSVAGFVEEVFFYLDDCRTFARWKLLNTAELCAWKVARAVGLPYLETCLLGVYRREPAAQSAG